MFSQFSSRFLSDAMGMIESIGDIPYPAEAVTYLMLLRFVEDLRVSEQWAGDGVQGNGSS